MRCRSKGKETLEGLRYMVSYVPASLVAPPEHNPLSLVTQNTHPSFTSEGSSRQNSTLGHLSIPVDPSFCALYTHPTTMYTGIRTTRMMIKIQPPLKPDFEGPPGLPGLPQARGVGKVLERKMQTAKSQRQRRVMEQPGLAFPCALTDIYLAVSFSAFCFLTNFASMFPAPILPEVPVRLHM
jgi:hypothetical protein